MAAVKGAMKGRPTDFVAANFVSGGLHQVSSSAP
jgi:hypothetical protein